MAVGGTFVTQNKVLPGTYINFVSKKNSMGTVSDRGVVAIPWVSPWESFQQVTRVSLEDFQNNSFKLFGMEYSHPLMCPIREVFKGGAKELLLYSCHTGMSWAKATISDEVTVRAKYQGSAGNNIKVLFEEEIGNSKYVNLTVYFKDFEGVYNEVYKLEEVLYSELGELVNNDSDNNYIYISGDTSKIVQDDIQAYFLTGGADVEKITTNMLIYPLSFFEQEDFNILVCPYDDSDLMDYYYEYTKRLRDDEGKKFQTVCYIYGHNHYEGIIDVSIDINYCYDGVSFIENGGAGENGWNLDCYNNIGGIYWVAGALAGCNVNESITNKKYDGEGIFSKYAGCSKGQLRDFIECGQFAFYKDREDYRILKDINSLTEFSSDKNADFANNQVIRVLDQIGEDVADIFNKYYLGKEQNNDLGRDIFKSELIDYFNQLQSINAIDNFTADDITVTKGREKGDVVVNIALEPVCAMDKLYMTVVVE